MSAQRKPVREAVKVLIAEDSPTQAEQLSHLLEENGYKVTAAGNGKEALAAAQKNRPDLVISDIVMPEMDGFTLCKEIKSKKTLKDIPVVLLTALSSPQDVIKGLQCGADNFIRKPYDGKYLISRIEYLLANRELRGGEKIQLGMKIRFNGEDYLITSERQQILDLLISIYEEAVHLNQDLEARQKELTRSYQSLNGLYKISESLNTSMTSQDVAEKALEKAVELPAVKAGWVVLREGEARFRIAAARDLPPALLAPGALDGSCFCREKLLAGELDDATNVLECERLQRASGDTQGLKYHASIPLWTHATTLGLLNLAGTESGLFSNADLKTLHSVGHQVAIALERAQLFENLEEKVRQRTAALAAEVVERKQAQEEAQRNLERIRALHEIDVAISSSLDLRTVLNVLLEKIDLFFPYPSATTVRLLDKESGSLKSLACRNIDEEDWRTRETKVKLLLGRTRTVIETRAPLAVRDLFSDTHSRDPDFYRRNGLISYLGVPLTAKGKVLGVLGFYSKEEREFGKEEIEFLNTLAGQAAIAIHNAQLYEEMVKANKVKDEFLSVMSHELRTPLNVVVGYTGMIMDGLLGEVNDKQKEAMEKIIRRTYDQLTMVNNILYATVLETEKTKVESHELSLGDFLTQLKSGYEAPINRELGFNWDYPANLPVIRTDSAKLKHVLHNLIDNAIKFTAKGSVTISCKIEESSMQKAESSRQPLPTADRLLPTGGGRWVEFKVADTGVGIPKEYLPFVFDKFRQADSSETRLYGGVGMGLYIVRKFTELLGGTVEVESEVGKGTTLTVTLPVEF